MSNLNIKEFILGILAAASSIAVFWLWSNTAPFIVDGKFGEYENFIAPVAGLIAAAALFSLTALFIKNKWIVYPAAAISVGAPYFFVSATNTVVGVLLASILLAIYAVARIRAEGEHSLGFSASKFLKAGLPLYFTVASIIISTFIFSEIGEDENKAFAALLPRSALKTAVGPVQSLIGLPDVKPNATVDEALMGLIISQLKSQGIENISKTELTRLVASQRAELSKNFGLKLSGQERLSDILYEFVSVRFRELLGPYKIYLPYASAGAFFLAFKMFTYPLYYLTLLITFLLIKLMLAVNILRREMQKVEVERLTL